MDRTNNLLIDESSTPGMGMQDLMRAFDVRKRLCVLCSNCHLDRVRKFVKGVAGCIILVALLAELKAELNVVLSTVLTTH